MSAQYTSPRPLTIVQIFNKYLQAGGEENSVARMATDWEAAGHRVIRFWKSTADWMRPGGPSRVQQALLFWNNRAVLEELRAVHEAQRPDVWIIHNVVPVISLGTYRLAKQLGVPIIRWLHNCRPVSVSGALFAGRHALDPRDRWRNLKEILAGAWNGPLATACLTLAYAVARARDDFSAVRAAVAISDATAEVFRQGGWFADRLFTLRHCWPPSPAPQEVEDDGTFLFLGRLVYSKGADFLLDLWRHPALANVPLVIAGDGPAAEHLRKVSPPGVRWTGHVTGEAKQALLRRCRAVVAPSRAHEALGIGIYEAYQWKKPVLSSDLGGPREIIQDGHTGRLLPAADTEAWLEAITSLDAVSAQRMGATARAWLDANTSPADWNRQFDAIVARVLGWRTDATQPR